MSGDAELPALPSQTYAPLVKGKPSQTEPLVTQQQACQVRKASYSSKATVYEVTLGWAHSMTGNAACSCVAGNSASCAGACVCILHGSWPLKAAFSSSQGAAASTAPCPAMAAAASADIGPACRLWLQRGRQSWWQSSRQRSFRPCSLRHRLPGTSQHATAQLLTSQPLGSRLSRCSLSGTALQV